MKTAATIASTFPVQSMTFKGRTRDVIVSPKTGRPVIVMHELLGVTPALFRFLDLLTEQGFKVYAPVLLGRSNGRNNKLETAGFLACIVHEFRVLSANDPGPWADWIRALAAHVFAECEGTPGQGEKTGVGVIGLCLTGNLALSAAMSPVVTGPVMSEPSLPFGRPGGLHVTDAELATVKMRIESEGLVVKGYRYTTDHLCKAQRFLDLEATLGRGFSGVQISTPEPKMHSVFTEDMMDDGGAFRHQEMRSLTDFLRARI